jgi:hypothetical protein
MYAAAWMVADCAAELAPFDAQVWPTVHRLSAHGAVQQFAPLTARFTALHDLLERPLPAHGPHITISRNGASSAHAETATLAERGFSRILPEGAEIMQSVILTEWAGNATEANGAIGRKATL